MGMHQQEQQLIFIECGKQNTHYAAEAALSSSKPISFTPGHRV
jgi:hypothetical protein